jgi:hypothetical protein
MGRHSQLRYYRAESVDGEIVIFEPSSGLSLEAEQTSLFGFRGIGSALDRLAARTRYALVLKFTPCGAGDYSVHGETYRGKGGWLWPLANEPLAKLAGRFVGKIGCLGHPNNRYAGFPTTKTDPAAGVVLGHLSRPPARCRAGY